ncbi:hypothetical protein EZV62_001113 [Acer yangbiense]|uniref:Uncharacterized protein n=1 Tax=Acer yangbiense TaxID=1000413 RepID=A0A5C7IUL3_9ROSI|nr:hypothetical protein EZV62_001113 [Acer yangbiense]
MFRNMHKAIAMRDYAGLRRILAALPRLGNPAEIRTESASLAEEEKADAISAMIDRRDVPNRDTPLHLAVKLGDETTTEMLMVAGADWSLQNEQGWSVLQEAICGREERISMIIVRHYQPLAWAKWCRRLPRLIATMQRMRDFFMEITFHFESSVIPFISRIVPSDTNKIWKRESEELNDILTEDERRQREVALKLDSSELSNENGEGIIAHRHSCYEHREISIEDANGCRKGESKQEKKGWFGGWRKRNLKPEPRKKNVPPRSSLCVDEKGHLNFLLVANSMCPTSCALSDDIYP